MSNFQRIFITPDAVNAIVNTLQISLCRLVFEFPMAILLALLLNEMRAPRLKRIYQTVYTFPHFLSWVVVGTMVTNIFASNGSINAVVSALGGERVNFLSSRALFRPLLYLTANWKEMGWSAIIYMATIAGIDPTLYEAGNGGWSQSLSQSYT